MFLRGWVWFALSYPSRIEVRHDELVVSTIVRPRSLPLRSIDFVELELEGEIPRIRIRTEDKTTRGPLGADPFAIYFAIRAARERARR